ncbi:GH92 family glycosyl hydrolase [Parapedobacter pyrenivorans]|uniref:GH92 family glycosyl hydrolase n=1 Tax=Parapedobacter pyrenivorans TaxID=1305674 RepID=UPI003342CE36
MRKLSDILMALGLLLWGASGFAQSWERDYVDYVDPLIESTKSRYFYFNSACRPFGMVNLSPDNILEKEWNSGYKYQEPYIRGLTHVHDWGVGGLLLMPTTGRVDPTKGPEGWKTGFSHEREQAQAGYHQVYFDDYQMNVELTSTTRVGFHRYTFDEGGEARILVYLGGQLGGGIMKNASLRKVSNTELEGWVIQESSVGDVKLFFVIQFDQPFDSITAWQGDKLGGAIHDVVDGEQLGAFATYNPKKGDQLQIKAGISWCSVDQARLNLQTEVDHWDFDQVRQESRDDWNQWLGRIDVKGQSEQQKIKFYTDVWRSLLGRRQIQDVNGMYPDYSGGTLQVKQLPLDAQGKPKFMHLSSDALWLTMWNLNILWGVAYPEVLESFVNSALVYHQDGGHLPRGPIIGRESWIMTSSPITELIVGAYMLGIRGYDIDAVYAALKKAHMPGGTMDMGGGFVQEYIDLGFVPETDPPQGWGGAGRVMEYVTQDWALSQLAQQLGKHEDAAYFLKRSANWFNMFDPSSGFIRPMNPDGSWTESFDPVLNANFGGFVEANTWQTTWMAVHDVKGLVNLLGGADQYCDKLNFAFEQAKADNFVGGYGGNYVNYSNQPGLAMAHLFNYAGKPWLSQYWVREVYDRTFSDITPYGGYGGNDEDQGQMASLSALMAMGLFDIKGGCDPDPIYQLTTPLFDTITIHLNPAYYPGKTFTITTANNTPANRYIQSAQLNGDALEQCWFRQEDLKNGGQLHLVLGPRPNESWGVQNPPPSETTGDPAFMLSDLSCPGEAAAGEAIHISYRVRNYGGVGTYFGKIESGGQTLAHQEEIIQSGEEKEIHYSFRMHDPGAHQLLIGGKPHTVHIQYRKSTLALQHVDIYNIGEQILGSGSVVNTGSDTLNQPVRVEANGALVANEQVHLLPGATEAFSFAYNAPSSGTYQLRINGELQPPLAVVIPQEKAAPGLALYYDFDHTATPLLDLSGSKLHPQRQRLPTITQEGPAGARFEKNNHLKIESADQLNAGDAIAISLVLYPTNWYSFGRVLQKGAADNQFMIYRNGGNDIEFKLTGVHQGTISTTLPPVNQWTHLVCQYDSKKRKIAIWSNGKLVAEKEAFGKILPTPDPLFIGVKNERSGLEDSFSGVINELRIYNRALSPAEITEIAAQAVQAAND